MRLDQLIPLRNPGISRRKARELIAAGRVLVNERVVSVASREVREDARIRVVEADLSLPIITESDGWVAVNKPVGVPTQPTRDRKVLSMEEMLRARYREIYPVHRIDTPTSGVVLFARTRELAARLSALFAKGEIVKTYLAIADPPLDGPRVIESDIEDRPALTRITPRTNGVLQVVIETGRRHQIRIHLASIGHPVRGDRRYGGAAAPRLMLHAWTLEHELIGKLEAPAPPEFSPGGLAER